MPNTSIIWISNIWSIFHSFRTRKKNLHWLHTKKIQQRMTFSLFYYHSIWRIWILSIPICKLLKKKKPISNIKRMSIIRLKIYPINRKRPILQIELQNHHWPLVKLFSHIYHDWMRLQLEKKNYRINGIDFGYLNAWWEKHLIFDVQLLLYGNIDVMVVC